MDAVASITKDTALNSKQEEEESSFPKRLLSQVANVEDMGSDAVDIASIDIELDDSRIASKTHKLCTGGSLGYSSSTSPRDGVVDTKYFQKNIQALVGSCRNKCIVVTSLAKKQRSATAVKRAKFFGPNSKDDGVVLDSALEGGVGVGW